MNILLIYILNVFILFASCGQVTSNRSINKADSPQAQKDTCDDPDANINCSFLNMPENLTSVLSIADNNEQGEKLVISGTVFKHDGKTPYPGVVLYAYQTDSKGYYSKTGKEKGAQKWHGRLHGWCKTDHKGYYQINSIRPAPYPDNSMPAHIHMAVKEPQGKEPYYVSDFVFSGDRMVNDKYLNSIQSLVGGTGVVNLTKSADGSWRGQRDIVLSR